MQGRDLRLKALILHGAVGQGLQGGGFAETVAIPSISPHPAIGPGATRLPSGRSGRRAPRARRRVCRAEAF